ncbi:sugar kinase [Planctomycetales bacterium]|nr:sugar kinase [Planctomycetales bacterium]
MKRCICSGILFADVACFPISHLPSEGELVTTKKIELNLGGCAGNVALNLSRLGIGNYLSGCVGDDALSDFIVRSVAVPNVDIELQHSLGNCPGTAMHINVQGEDRRFICTTGANDDYVFDDKLLDIITAPLANNKLKNEKKIFYLGGFFMLRALENERTPEILKTAQENGWTTLVDVVLYGERNYWDVLKPLLPFTDIFIPNEHEGEKVSDYRDPYEQAEFFLKAGVKTVIITQGDGGILYFDGQKQFQTGVYPVEFVSGSGAGDAFCAGLIAGLLEGLPPDEAIRWGCAQGASCVRGVGTTEKCFNREELLAFMQQNELPIETV